MPKKAVLLYISESKGILPSVNNKKMNRICTFIYNSNQ